MQNFFPFDLQLQLWNYKEYYFMKCQSCLMWMLQKCLNWWRWSMDSPGLTLFNPGSSTTYWCCTWSGCVQFHQDSMEKDTVFTQELSREGTVSCFLQEKKLVLRHQKFMKTWISAAIRSQPFDHTVSKEYVHCMQRWIGRWSVVPYLFMYDTEEMWKLAACLPYSCSLPPTLMDDDSALIAQAHRLTAAAGKQYKELC